MTAAGSRTSKSPRSQAIAALISLGVITSILLTTIFYSLPSNVLSVRDGGRLRTLSVNLAQQSWVFFTRSPSYNEFVPYRVTDDGHVKSVLRFPQARPANAFGLSRRQRAQGPEMALITNQLTTWEKCSDFSDIRKCAHAVADAATQVQRVTNTSTAPSICGRSVLVETEPVRWAWRNSYDVTRLPVRAAVVQVHCENGDGVRDE